MCCCRLAAQFHTFSKLIWQLWRATLLIWYRQQSTVLVFRFRTQVFTMVRYNRFTFLCARVSSLLFVTNRLSLCQPLWWCCLLVANKVEYICFFIVCKKRQFSTVQCSFLLKFDVSILFQSEILYQLKSNWTRINHVGNMNELANCCTLILIIFITNQFIQRCFAIYTLQKNLNTSNSQLANHIKWVFSLRLKVTDYR